MTVLHLTQGATGGIGRVESLLGEVWARDVRLDVTTVRRDFVQIELPPALRRGKATARMAWTLTILGAIARTRADAVLLGHLNLAPFAAVSRALHPGTRIVIWAYGSEAWTRPGILTRAGLRFVDEVWSISKHTAHLFSAASGFPGHRIVVVPLALQPELAAALAGDSPPSGPSSAHPEVLTVSRLWRGDAKGVEHLILAMRRTPSAVRLTIVGDGDDRARLEAIAVDAGLASRVTFTGRLDDAHLIELYRRCSMFVLPSDREGFGLVFLEAMAAGKPVIGARSAAVPELVRDGESGLLVPYGDPVALAAAINGLLDDPLAAARLGERGHRRALEDFAFSRFAAQVGDLLVGARQAGPVVAGSAG